jgi:hypothetical protein
MVNSFKVSDGEMSKIRRNVARNFGDYSEVTRGLASCIKDPLAFIADENVWFQNLMMFDAMKEITNWVFRGRKFNPDDYFNKNPVIYRKTHLKFKTSSRDGYLVGRDFLTNQPIFKSYN